MCFEKLLRGYKKQYQHGYFVYQQGDCIEQVAERNRCPDGYGVYLIYGVRDNSEELIYIGAAGELLQNGTFRGQGIRGRLSNTRKGKSADRYYHDDLLTRYGFLKFEWFVTFDNKNNRILPKYAEAELIQHYYNEYNRLPVENKEF